MSRCSPLFGVFFGLSALGGVAFLASAAEEKAKKGGPPPLVVDRDEPLLLEEPSGKEKEATKGLAKNDACFVCHVNYRDEPLVLQHAKLKIGCVNCHGKSYAHRNDENNTTPPERMYPAEKIDESCKNCHEEHDVPAAQVIALWFKRCPDKRDPQKIVCTDCHGNHRLEIRSVRWNKKTGELIKEKKGALRKDSAGKAKSPAPET